MYYMYLHITGLEKTEGGFLEISGVGPTFRLMEIANYFPSETIIWLPVVFVSF